MSQVKRESNVEYLKELVAVLESSNIILQEENKRLKQQQFNSEQARLELRDNLSIIKNRFIFKGSEKLNPTRSKKDSSDGLLHNRIVKNENDSYESSLDVQEVIHKITDYDKSCSCPKCSSSLGKMKGQFEESTEVDVIERTYIKSAIKDKSTAVEAVI